MNFMIYPHDTQLCKLQMESREYSSFVTIFSNLFLVSHTTDDLIFQWDPDVPLVVDENIELPQLALLKNYTEDCTQVYSTGKSSFSSLLVNIDKNLQEILRVWKSFSN